MGMYAPIPYSILKEKTQVISTTGVAITSSTQGVFLDSSSGALSVTLPPHQDFMHARLELIDLGSAAANNVTINAAGTDTISGDAFLILNTDYESVVLYPAPAPGLWIGR